MGLSLAAFVVVSLFAFLVALLLLDGLLWPVLIGVFCGFAAATVLNFSDVVERRSGRGSAGGGADADVRGDGGANRRDGGRAP